ncbi:MAG TPA: hypothetical protein VF177_05170 [Anaerolineae bacterium]
MATKSVIFHLLAFPNQTVDWRPMTGDGIVVAGQRSLVARRF